MPILVIFGISAYVYILMQICVPNTLCVCVCVCVCLYACVTHCHCWDKRDKVLSLYRLSFITLSSKERLYNILLMCVFQEYGDETATGSDSRDIWAVWSVCGHLSLWKQKLYFRFPRAAVDFLIVFVSWCMKDSLSIHWLKAICMLDFINCFNVFFFICLFVFQVIV